MWETFSWPCDSQLWTCNESSSDYVQEQGTVCHQNNVSIS